VQAVLRVRQALKPADESVKAKDVQVLVDSVKADETTMEQAVEGLRVLEEMGVSAEEREEYVSAARERWRGAGVFRQR